MSGLELAKNLRTIIRNYDLGVGICFDIRKAAEHLEAAPDLAKEVEMLKDWLQYAINIIDKGNLYEVQCCDGHMCGCQASTYADEFLHYARTLLPLGKGEGL